MNAPHTRLRADARYLHPQDVLDCVLNGRIGVVYRPLVSTATGRVLGHAARARCWLADGTPIAPDTLFRRLHEEPMLLYHLELTAKRIQLAHCPPDGLLFVTLDADGFELGHRPDGSNSFTELFAGSPAGRRLVVEVVENLQVRDVMFSRRMIDLLAAEGIKVAMDDQAVSGGLLAFGALTDAAYLRFHLGWLQGRDQARRERVMHWSLDAARALNVMTLLDGVSSDEDLAFARTWGFDLVQGPRFAEIVVGPQASGQGCATGG